MFSIARFPDVACCCLSRLSAGPQHVDEIFTLNPARASLCKKTPLLWNFERIDSYLCKELATTSCGAACRVPESKELHPGTKIITVSDMMIDWLPTLHHISLVAWLESYKRWEVNNNLQSNKTPSPSLYIKLWEHDTALTPKLPKLDGRVTRHHQNYHAMRFSICL